MNAKKSGDKYCLICGKWIGNYNTGETPEGTASYYSIIKRKYCPTCKPWKRSFDVRFNQAEYRKRKRELTQKKDKLIEELREQIENEGIKVVNANGNSFPIANQKDILFLNNAIDYLYKQKYDKEIINSLESLLTLLELQNNIFTKGDDTVD